jgi:hypothetical protein
MLINIAQEYSHMIRIYGTRTAQIDAASLKEAREIMAKDCVEWEWEEDESTEEYDMEFEAPEFKKE